MNIASTARIRNPGGAAAGLLLAAWLGALPASAQPSVELRILTIEAYQNEPIELELRVHNFTDDAGIAALPEIPNAALRVARDSVDFQSTHIVQGRVSRNITRTFPLELLARTAGTVEIPPIEVNVDGSTLRTRPARVQVRSADGTLMFAEITCEEPRLFVGQRVRFTLSIWVKPPRVDDRIVDERTMMQFFRGTQLPPFPGDVQTERRRRALPGEPEQTFYVYTSSLSTTLDREGPVSFDSVVVAMTYPARFGRDIFGEIANVSGRKLRVKPEVLAPPVQPLPSAGRPANFTGAVGELTVSASADATDVRVGDPISLTLEIGGDVALETLTAPNVAAQEDVAAAFRVPSETLAGSIVNGRKRFTQVLRARSADVREIPAIEMPYFEPRSAEYRVARSRPIPLRVSASDALSAADVEGLSATAPTAEALRPLDGLLGIETNAALLLAQSFAPSPLALLLVTGGPGVLFGLVWAGCALRTMRGSDVARRRQSARRVALERLTSPSVTEPRAVAAAIVDALSGYLADRTGAPPARYQAAALESLLRGLSVSAETARQSQSLLERCQGAAYGAAGSEAPEGWVREARELLDRLERELR